MTLEPESGSSSKFWLEMIRAVRNGSIRHWDIQILSRQVSVKQRDIRRAVTNWIQSDDPLSAAEHALFAELDRRDAYDARDDRRKKVADQVALSVIYLNTVLRQDLALWMFLTVSALTFVVIRYFVVVPVISVIAPIVVMVLVRLRSQVLKYRIMNGLYGTNEYEARQIIGYILQNSYRIDFGSGDGKLRKALLPEAKSEVVECANRRASGSRT